MLWKIAVPLLIFLLSEYIRYNNTLSLHLHPAHIQRWQTIQIKILKSCFPLNSQQAALYLSFRLLSSKSWSIWLTVGAWFGGMDRSLAVPTPSHKVRAWYASYNYVKLYQFTKKYCDQSEHSTFNQWIFVPVTSEKWVK